MKTLCLMRHAKSSWKDASLSDRERPLKARGRRDAAEMGHRLTDHGFLPQRVLCSPALRARQTASILLEAASADPVKMLIDERLYFQGMAGWLETLRSLGGRAETLLVVGHNPDFSELVAHLSGTAVVDLPTAAVAILTFAGDWRVFPQGDLRMIDRDWPNKS